MCVCVRVRTHNVDVANGVQVGGVVAVLQVGQRCAEYVVHASPAVVVPLHVEEVGDGVDGWRSETTPARLNSRTLRNNV